MIDRIQEDHENAARLTRGIDKIEGLCIDLARVQTNLVYFDVADERTVAEDILTRLAAKGVKILQVGPLRFRAVTHYGIRRVDIDQAVSALTEVMKSF